MLPGDGITAGIGKDKTCFTTDANYKFKYGSEGLNTSEIKEYIRNPHKFNTKYEMDGKYYNLWSTDNDKTDNNDDVVIKSVYDPSPVGYSLPASNAFTGFTTTGQNVGNGNIGLFNVKGGFNKGWYFYTKQNKQGGTVFFPASGYRFYTLGSLNYVTTLGVYWVAGPGNRGHGRYLGFDSGSVNPLNDTYRNYGLSVRSAEEKEVDVGCRDLQCADFRCASSSPCFAWVPSIYDVMDDTVAHCNSIQHTKRLTL